MAGFFARISNLWSGFLSLFIADLETSNPAAVYEAAIDQRTQQYANLKKGVSAIVHLRNKTQQEYDAAQTSLRDVLSQIPVAIEAGDDEVAMVLLEKQEQLEGQMASLEGSLEQIKAQAENAKQGLISFQADIKKLKREKDAMLAKAETAKARIAIQEQLSGISVEADIKALDNVRTHIDKLHAEADVSEEVAGSSLDARLAAIKNKTGSSSARLKLEAMKKARASQASAPQRAAQKTI